MKTSIRNILALVACALVIAMLLAACGPAPVPTSVPVSPTPVPPSSKPSPSEFSEEDLPETMVTCYVYPSSSRVRGCLISSKKDEITFNTLDGKLTISPRKDGNYRLVIYGDAKCTVVLRGADASGPKEISKVLSNERSVYYFALEATWKMEITCTGDSLTDGFQLEYY